MNWKTLAGGVAASVMVAAIVQPADAQVTTSSVRGVITDESGSPVAGATAVITHEPTGSVSTVTTGPTGAFQVRGLRPGGPYTVAVSGGDFTPVEVTDIAIGVNEVYPLELAVSGQRTMQTVVVTGTAVQGRGLDTGVSTLLTAAELAEVTSIDRDIADAAQLDPFAVLNFQGDGDKELSFAGANNRFNALTIDGVALNDRFGLNSNGYPTQRSPIPYDAIQSLDVQSAPYGVEFNGFTGGSINAVTKSGGNELSGSAFYEYSDDSLAGDSINGRDIDQSFEEKGWGVTLGGPILQDRLFGFVAYEKFEAADTLSNGPVGSGALNERNISQATVDEIASVAQSVYNFDVGQFAVSPVEEEKYLINLDWNITNDHRAKFTYIKNEGSEIQQQSGNSFLTDRSVDVLGFSSSWYNRSEEVDTYIAQVFSQWTDNFSTEFAYSNTTQATGQDSLGGAEFPLFAVRVPGAEADTIANVAFGPDTFRHGNELDQEFIQYKAKATYFFEDHAFKFGYEREEVDVNNLFAPSSEGQYFFESIDALRNQQAAELLYENAITNDENDRRALWGYNYNSLYVEDVWSVSPTFDLQYGVRYDWYEAEGSIRQNDNFENRFGFSNTNDIDGLDVFMPRISFTWDASDVVRVRGGVGRFSGGAPNVWVSNTYSNDGVTNESVFFRDVIVPTTPDAATGQFIPQEALDALANEAPDGPVNALLPDFEIPSTIKANLGVVYDADFGQYLGDGWVLSADVLYNKYENAPFWRDESCDIVNIAPDGRNVYSCTGPEAITTGSIDEGQGFLFALSANKEWDTDFGFFSGLVSYTHQDIEDIGQGTSSTATSNYSDTPRFDLNVPTVGTSNFETEHLLKLRATWEQEFFGDYATRVSMFATRRSGQPYSYTFNTDGRNDVFGIRENRADDAGALFYVPSGPNDPLFSPLSFGGDAAAQAAFFNYIDNSELAAYRGGITERNGDQSRWSTIVDMKLSQELPGALADHRTIFEFSIENIGNLLNDEWGRVERVRYEYEQQVASASIANGQYVYDDLDTTLNIQTLNQSLWRAKVGIRYEF